MVRPIWLTSAVERLPRVGSRVSDEAADRLADAGHDVLHLHAHPERPLPAHVLDVVSRAARANLVAPSRGLPGLRGAVARVVAEELGRAVDPVTEVLITAGGMQALDLVFGATLAAGDEVLALAPGFFVEGLIAPRSARLVSVDTRLQDEFAVNWEAVERAITPATRVLLVITPGNPTGYVLSRADVDSLAEIVERHNLLIVSDESYDRLVYDGLQHLSPCAHPALAERSVLIRSFTKSFAMPGWRVGYIVAPRTLVDGCLKLLEWTALYGSAVPQAAAEAALSGPQDWLYDVAPEFQARRDRLVAVMRELGLPTVTPRGGPFLFPRVAAHGDDVMVAERLLSAYGIPVVAGSLLRGPGHVRLPVGGDSQTIDRLANRLHSALAVQASGAPA
jgi:aspartate/methionine/tyrosine aminotransferase